MYAISRLDNDIVIRLMVRVNQQHDGSISSGCVGQYWRSWARHLLAITATPMVGWSNAVKLIEKKK